MPQNHLLIHRIAVSLFFFVNGFLYANWTARLPELQRFYALNDGQLGRVLFCIALGSIVSMPVAGWLGGKFGSDRVVRGMALLFCVAVPLVALSQEEWTIRLCFFFLGVASGSMDVTMNGQAVLVERRWGRVIFSSFHAVFSIGMALGAATGALFSRYQIGLTTHLLTMAVLGALVLIWAAANLIEDRPAPVVRTDSPVRMNYAVALRAILPLGLIALCSMTGEGSMVDWSAIFMNRIVGQSDVVSAWAFGTFGVAMTVGRLFGDAVTARLGKQRMMFIDALLATAGLGLAVLFPHVWTTFLGFFLVGLGLSTIVPIVFSSAGNMAGIAPSVGIAIATSIGYTGFFIGPPLIGFLSETFTLRVGLGFVLFLFVVMAVIIVLYRQKQPNDSIAQPSHQPLESTEP